MKPTKNTGVSAQKIYQNIITSLERTLSMGLGCFNICYWSNLLPDTFVVQKHNRFSSHRSFLSYSMYHDRKNKHIN